MIKSKIKHEFGRLYHNITVKIREGLEDNTNFKFDNLKIGVWYTAQEELEDAYFEVLYNGNRNSNRPLELVYYEEVCSKLLTFSRYYDEAKKFDFFSDIFLAASRVQETLIAFASTLRNESFALGIELKH
jgi:flavodoxin